MKKLFLFAVALAFVGCAMPAEEAEVKGVGFFHATSWRNFYCWLR